MNNTQTQLSKLKERMTGKNLEELLEEIQVEPQEDNEFAPKGISEWFAVSTDVGLIAYFEDESDALRFRLNLINNILNG